MAGVTTGKSRCKSCFEYDKTANDGYCRACRENGMTSHSVAVGGKCTTCQAEPSALKNGKPYCLKCLGASENKLIRKRKRPPIQQWQYKKRRDQ